MDAASPKSEEFRIHFAQLRGHVQGSSQVEPSAGRYYTSTRQVQGTPATLLRTFLTSFLENPCEGCTIDYGTCDPARGLRMCTSCSARRGSAACIWASRSRCAPGATSATLRCCAADTCTEEGTAVDALPGVHAVQYVAAARSVCVLLRPACSTHACYHMVTSPGCTRARWSTLVGIECAESLFGQIRSHGDTFQAGIYMCCGQCHCKRTISLPNVEN